jgi:hypothetical protein
MSQRWYEQLMRTMEIETERIVTNIDSLISSYVAGKELSKREMRIVRRKLRRATEEEANSIINSIRDDDADAARFAYVKLVSMRNAVNDEGFLEHAAAVYRICNDADEDAVYQYWKITEQHGFAEYDDAQQERVRRFTIPQLSLIGSAKSMYIVGTKYCETDQLRKGAVRIAAKKGYHRAQLDTALADYADGKYSNSAYWFKQYIQQSLKPLNSDIQEKVIDVFAKAGESCNPYGCWRPHPAVHCWVDMENHARVETVMLACKRNGIPRDIAFMIIRLMITK